MLNTEFVEGVRALIGTPYAKCDCKDVIAKPLGIRFSGTKEECLRQQIIENVFSVRRYAVQEKGKTRLFFSAAE